MRRSIIRGAIRKKYGKGSVQSMWEKIQIKRYGLGKLNALRAACSPRSVISIDR